MATKAKPKVKSAPAAAVKATAATSGTATTKGSSTAKPVTKKAVVAAPALAAKAVPVSAPKAAPVTAPKAKSVSKAKAAAKVASGVGSEQRRNYVEVAAFFIAQRRGFAPGDSMADWLAAEAQVNCLIAEGKIGA